MEVHHHSHSERKKWTHYIWEFFMLFLAVFCGFLAENQREHYIEHLREKQYMQSLLEDLVQDTLEMGRISRVNQQAILNIDTLLDEKLLLDLLDADQGNRKRLYQLAAATMGAEQAVFSQRTLSQLKNAGGLRLVRDKEVADLISVYDNKIQALSVISNSLDESTTDVARQASEILDLNYYRAGNDGKFELINYDHRMLARFSNTIQIAQAVFLFYENHLVEEKQVATRLIHLIQEKYHPK